MTYFCPNCVSVWSGRDYNDPDGSRWTVRIVARSVVTTGD